MNLCPCRLKEQSTLSLDQCCGPYLQGQKKVPTAEALMRSRYSAYATYNIDYVAKTHKQTPGESFDQEEALKWAKDSSWNGLVIHHTHKGQEKDTQGVVEFTAFYDDKNSGKSVEHKEKAFFEKVQGDWIFVEGQIVGIDPLKRSTPKVGRNDVCPCGSGKKYKKCCGQ